MGKQILFDIKVKKKHVFGRKILVDGSFWNPLEIGQISWNFYGIPNYIQIFTVILLKKLEYSKILEDVDHFYKFL